MRRGVRTDFPFLDKERATLPQQTGNSQHSSSFFFLLAIDLSTKPCKFQPSLTKGLPTVLSLSLSSLSLCQSLNTWEGFMSSSLCSNSMFSSIDQTQAPTTHWLQKTPVSQLAFHLRSGTAGTTQESRTDFLFSLTSAHPHTT